MIPRLVGVAVLLAVLLVAWPAASRPVWLALRGLVAAVGVLLAALVERRRARRAPPRRAQPAVRAWHVRLTTRVGQRPVLLVQGEVVGPWLDAAEVEAEALHRWAQVSGDGRRVYARARPLAPATRPEVRR